MDLLCIRMQLLQESRTLVYRIQRASVTSLNDVSLRLFDSIDTLCCKLNQNNVCSEYAVSAVIDTNIMMYWGIRNGGR